MIEVMDKVEHAIKLIDNSSHVKRLKELKIEMDRDNELYSLFKKFNKLKSDYEKHSTVTPEFVQLKEKIYKHSLVIEYRTIYSKLNVNILNFNKQLNTLINTKKKCQSI